MKKFISLTAIAVLLTVSSCRETDELLTIEETPTTVANIENNIASTVSESTTGGTSNNTTTNDENPPKDKIKW